MIPWHILQRCLVVAYGGMAFWTLIAGSMVADLAVAAEKPMKVIVLFNEGSQAGMQVAEQVLTQALRQRGYHVLDHRILTPPFRRESLPPSAPSTIQQLGVRLGADIVINGYAQIHVQEKTYSALDGKKVTIGQADVGARAILVSTGRVLVADHAQARKPFDAAGTGAVAQATTTLADKLLARFEPMHARQE